MSELAQSATTERADVRRIRRTSARPWWVLVAAAIGCLAIGAASAATLGSLGVVGMRAFDLPAVSGAPVVYASDGFTAADGTNLNGRAPLVGAPWVVDVPTFTITGNQVGTNGAGLANTLIQTGQVDARAEVTITATGNRASGIIFNDNGAVALYVVWGHQSGGRLRLIKYSGGPTILVNVTSVGTVSPGVLTVESQGDQVRVYMNGVLRITHTLSAPDLATYKSPANTRWGLIADGDPNSRFDDFRVESL